MSATQLKALADDIEALIRRYRASHEEAGDLLLVLATRQACREVGMHATENEVELMASAAGMRISEVGMALGFAREARAMVAAAPNN